MILGIRGSFSRFSGYAVADGPATTAGASERGVRGGCGGTLPRREGEETSGTTTTFDHVGWRRCDASHSTLRDIAVRRALVDEIQHCAPILSSF